MKLETELFSHHHKFIVVCSFVQCFSPSDLKRQLIVVPTMIMIPMFAVKLVPTKYFKTYEN